MTTNAAIIGGKDTLVTAGGNENCYSRRGDQCSASSKAKNRSTNPLLKWLSVCASLCCVCVYACEYRCPQRPEGLGTSELERTVGNCPTWVLGIELIISERADTLLIAEPSLRTCWAHFVKGAMYSLASFSIS